MIVRIVAGEQLDETPADLTIHWDRYASADPHTDSIPRIVHESPEKWINQYFEWLRSVGSAYSGSPESQDFSRRQNGFCYWWATLPTGHLLMTRCESLQQPLY